MNPVPPDLQSQPDMYINETDIEVLVIPVDIPLIAMTAVHDAPSPVRRMLVVGRDYVELCKSCELHFVPRVGAGAKN